MRKEELFKAFREAASDEFSEIPADEGSISYEFSDPFRQQMSDLLERREKRPLRFKRNTILRRAVIAICVVALFVIARWILSAWQIAPSEQIKEAETTEYQQQMQGAKNKADSSEDSAIKGIQKHYKLTRLPEGFREVRVKDTSTKITTIYQDNKGNRIIFSQEIRMDSQRSAENGLFDENPNKEKNIDLSIYETYATARWTDDQYSFTLSLFGKYDKETILGLVDSVQ